MNDYKTIEQLRKEYANLDNYILSLSDDITELEHKNKELENSVIELRKYYQSLDKFAATVYDPKKLTYKQLEEQLSLAENSKQAVIDDLLKTKVIPLNQQITDLKQQLTTSYDVNQGQKNRIKDLEIVRDNLNRMIDFAVGYISATQPHTDKHPMEIKQWLFKGLE